MLVDLVTSDGEASDIVVVGEELTVLLGLVWRGIARVISEIETRGTCFGRGLTHPLRSCPR